MRDFLRRLLERRAPAASRGARWVVIDCETSGLDAARDRLLALGAVAVRDARIDPADSFYAVLRQDAPSPAENMLVHGIGADAQRAGRPPAEALAAFARYLGEGLPVAFHADFDAAVLARALKAAGLKAPAPWLDLARLAPALRPESARRDRSLDDWLERCAIAPAVRHDALADAYSAAQLLLVLLAEGERQRAGTVEDLQRAARAAGWLGAR